jgi:hypothetical protein
MRRAALSLVALLAFAPATANVPKDPLRGLSMPREYSMPLDERMQAYLRTPLTEETLGEIAVPAEGERVAGYPVNDFSYTLLSSAGHPGRYVLLHHHIANGRVEEREWFETLLVKGPHGLAIQGMQAARAKGYHAELSRATPVGIAPDAREGVHAFIGDILHAMALYRNPDFYGSDEQMAIDALLRGPQQKFYGNLVFHGALSSDFMAVSTMPQSR